jgi:hypothetical protein
MKQIEQAVDISRGRRILKIYDSLDAEIKVTGLDKSVRDGETEIELDRQEAVILLASCTC